MAAPADTSSMNIFPGKDVFRLKDEVGLPFAIAFGECVKNDLMIDWVGLLEEARAKGWWDYQTIEAIDEAFADSQAWPDKRGEIMRRIRAYVVLRPHPGLSVGALQQV